MDQKMAKNVYRWLWFSPFLTIPTLLVFLYLDPGYLLVCSRNFFGDCNWALADRISSVIAILISSLWHLVLLKQALYKKNPFVHWHGRQGLALAGLRTAIPLFFAFMFGLGEIISALFIPILVVVWLFGTILGQNQVKRGECSFARWFGGADAFSSQKPDVVVKVDRVTEPHVSEEVLDPLIHIIRFSKDQKARKKALSKLTKLGVVEDL